MVFSSNFDIYMMIERKWTRRLSDDFWYALVGINYDGVNFCERLYGI